MNSNYCNPERVILKILFGLVIWTAGTLVFAWLCWQAPAPELGAATIWEMALGAMSVAYFCGVPIVFGTWIAKDFER